MAMNEASARSTSIFGSRSDFRPASESVYLYGQSIEERSHFDASWMAACTEVEFVRLYESTSDDMFVGVGHPDSRVSLRARSEVRGLLARAAGRILYLDITGLSHHVWAPIVKSAWEMDVDLRSVYVEPAAYKFSALPREGEVFDLSERIRGLRPLPGFATLRRYRHSDPVLVLILGFEGARTAYVLEAVQPAGDRVVPVIGVPGFRAEYPFFTYEGNRKPLSETGTWRQARYASANCPFDVQAVLAEIQGSYEAPLQIALIGTKPHSLGAVIFALRHPGNVELIYDHPIRKSGRTEGEGRLLVYDVAGFSRTGCAFSQVDSQA
jgi:hypothetical protein